MRVKNWVLASIVVATCQAAALKPLGSPCPQGDGFYAVGCSQFYLQCVNGFEYQQTCPEGLYFDRLLSRCERRKNNKSCTQRTGRVGNVRQKALVIDCTNKASGDYEIEQGKCDENYYQCANEVGYMRKCPHNQYFSSNLKRCDFYENCVSSSKNRDKVKKSAAAAHALYPDENAVVESEEIEKAPNGIDCGLLENATISHLPCSPHFWQCASGSLFRKKCPAGLVYDLEENLCEYPANKKGCPEYNKSEENTAATQDVGAPAPPPARPTTEKPVYKSFVCNSTDDGFFALGFCKHIFVSCFGGVSREISCADNLVYDPRINACDYPLACESERKHEEIPNLFNHGGIAEKKNKTVEPVLFNCSDKVDGYYVEKPCENKYIQCNDKTAYALKCPSDLVFNQYLNVCDFVDNCDKSTPETTVGIVPAITEAYKPTTTASSAVEGYTQSETVAYTQETTTSAATIPYRTTSAPVVAETLPTAQKFTCADLVDGNYASGTCEKTFYQCWNKYASATKCPATLVFNPYQGQCDYKENVADCQGNVESTKPETSNDNAPGYEPVESSTATPTTTTVTTTRTTTSTTTPPTTQAPVAEVFEHSEPFCERLADGVYGVGCGPIFFKCNNFATSKHRCPTGLIFNIKEIICDYPHNVQECLKLGYTAKPTSGPIAPSSQYEPTTTPYVPTTTSYTEATTTTEAEEEKQQHVDFSCTGRVDGIYALPYCSRKYVQCVNGRSLVESCASGLYYSEATGLCDYKEGVPNCVSNSQSNTIEETACEGKTDGYYSNGCSAEYFSCIEEKYRSMTCPSNLKFSSKKGVCDYPKDVEECIVKTGTPPTVSIDFCKTKKDGLHEYKTCSPHYVVCDNHISITGTCATPLIFNPTTELCDYKNNNSQCAY